MPEGPFCQIGAQIHFLNFLPGYLLIIFYQLTKINATCCNSFLDILITSFQCQNLERA